MKILVIGCSFSATDSTDSTHAESVPINYKHNWTYKLTENHPYTVYNAALCGVDVDVCTSILREQLSILKPDVVLYEITYRLRKTYSPIRDKPYQNQLTEYMEWKNPDDKFYHYGQIQDTKLNKTEQLIDRTQEHQINFPFLVGWARHHHYFKATLSDHKQIEPPYNNESSIWWKELTDKHQLFDKDFYKKIINDIGINNLLDIEALGTHKVNQVNQQTKLEYYRYIQAIESAKYLLQKESIPHLIFCWGSLNQIDKTPNHSYDKMLNDQTGIIDFSIYDNFPMMEMFALDTMLHLNADGHTEVSRIVAKQMEKIL